MRPFTAFHPVKETLCRLCDHILTGWRIILEASPGRQLTSVIGESGGCLWAFPMQAWPRMKYLRTLKHFVPTSSIATGHGFATLSFSPGQHTLQSDKRTS